VTESCKHRTVLEIRKNELEKQLAAVEPLRAELLEINMLLASYMQQSRNQSTVVRTIVEG